MSYLSPRTENNQVSARIVLQQVKSKHYTDAKRGVKPPKVTVGDKVLVCKPFHMRKGERLIVLARHLPV